DMTDEIVRSWRRVLIGKEFIEKVLSAVRIRRGMERSALQAHVAFTAGHPRNKPVMTGAATVVDILMAAQLLIDSEGKLIATDSQGTVEADDDDHAPGVTEFVPEPRPGERVPVRAPTLVTSVSGVPIQIQIQLQCTPD